MPSYRNKYLQTLFKKVRSILNKLTSQKFSTLMKKLSKMEVNTEERLKGVADLIFETVSLITCAVYIQGHHK